MLRSNAQRKSQLRYRLVAVVIFSCGLLSGCGRTAPENRAPATPPTQEAPSEFTTHVKGNVERTRGERNAGSLYREFQIRYDGRENLKQVEITLVLDFVSREHREERVPFDSWAPGETKRIEIEYLSGRAVRWSWSGTATVNEKRIGIGGNTGSDG